MESRTVSFFLIVALCSATLFGCKKSKVPAAQSSESGIESFVFNDLKDPANVNITGTSIKISLPPGTDPTSLRPIIKLKSDKATILPATGEINNFLTSKTYTVIAENGSKVSYQVELQTPTTSAKDKPTTPKSLCIYYAWPSTVNGSNGNTAAAINIFKDFDLIVFGNGIWQTTHGDNTRTKAIIAGLKSIKPSIKIYGYIDVSTTIQNLSESQLKAAIDGWQQMGVNGVFGDDFDLDYGVNRSRQNLFIDYAHSKGLSVFANGYRIEDVLGGADCHLNGTNSDYYLMESFFISDGNYTPLQSNIDKANRAYFYMKTKGVAIACVAREMPANVNSATYQTDKFKQSWNATAMFNFDAFQYTNKNFSSQNEPLYYFPNPITTYGTSWIDFDWVRKVSETRYERSTNSTNFYISGDGTKNGTGGH